MDGHEVLSCVLSSGEKHGVCSAGVVSKVPSAIVNYAVLAPAPYHNGLVLTFTIDNEPWLIFRLRFELLHGDGSLYIRILH